MGFMTSDLSSPIRSYSSTLISTPVPRSVEDVADVIKTQEEDIGRLESENIKQRQEVYTISLFFLLYLYTYSGRRLRINNGSLCSKMTV